MDSVGVFQRDSGSKTCHYRSLRFEDLRPRQAMGRGAGGTPRMEIAGLGSGSWDRHRGPLPTPHHSGKKTGRTPLPHGGGGRPATPPILPDPIRP